MQESASANDDLEKTLNDADKQTRVFEEGEERKADSDQAEHNLNQHL
jgi:hypothetical protein